MSNKEKPVFDNCRAGDIINSEHDYYNRLLDISEHLNLDESDYFDNYYKNNKKSPNYDSDSDSE